MRKSIVLMAQERGFDAVERREEWNGFSVYAPVFNDDEDHIIGLPHVILEKGVHVRWSTFEETNAILEREINE